MAEDAAEVTLTLQGGNSYRVVIANATGAPENPLTDAQLEEKFRVLTGDVLPKTRVEQLLNLLWNLDQVNPSGRGPGFGPSSATVDSPVAPPIWGSSAAPQGYCTSAQMAYTNKFQLLEVAVLSAALARQPTAIPLETKGCE